MRHCIRCDKWKEETEFNLRNIKDGKLQYVCRDCQKEQGRELYANNTERVKEIYKQSRLRLRAQAEEFLFQYLSNKACEDCGEKDLTVLTFDHTKGQKKDNIADLSKGGYSLETLKAEIDKTEVVCFNCHMRREQKRRGYSRFGRNSI